MKFTASTTGRKSSTKPSAISQSILSRTRTSQKSQPITSIKLSTLRATLRPTNFSRYRAPSFASACAAALFRKALWKAYKSPIRRLPALAYSPIRSSKVFTKQSHAESSAFNSIVPLLILTGQRRGEIASIQSSWVDLENKTLTIPASATKNAREHTIPISSTAQTLLSFCKKDGLFFQARGSTNRPFCGWSKSKVTLDKLCGVKNWTLHDIRRTYRTIHARIGTPPHIAERLVNHVSSRSAMQDVYDRHTYLPEMRQAVENYEKYLQSIGVG
jgi:Integrase